MSISVVVPIYNSADTLSACIESIQNQTFSDIELILVDDGSTDGSSEICDNYTAKDHRIHVVHQPNKGRTEARKVGVNKATGEWLCFVDSDDTLPANALSILYSAVENDVDIVLGNGFTLPNEQRRQIPMTEFRHLAVRGEGNIGLPWGSLYRRNILSDYLFDIPRHIMMGEDYIFWLRLVFSTEKPVNVVYETVYQKGDDHTCSTFRWTSEYCYELNELRMEAIPAEQRDDYLSDTIDDRLVNLYAVAVHEPQRIWRCSPYYQDIIDDMKRLNRKLPFRKRLFLLMPHLKNSFPWLLFLMIVFIGMAGLQLFDTMTLSDDLLYHFVWQQDEASPIQPLTTLSDLITSQWTHYHVINGRWVVHTLAQAFLSFTPPAVYQIINALLFPLMLYLASCLMVGRKNRLFSIVLMCFLLFVVVADIKTTILWSMGSFNYLWVCVATLSFLLWLRYVRASDNRIHWLLSPLSILVGCSHEAIALPLSITLLIYTVTELRKDRLYPQILYILWYVAGMLMCLLSPGIWQRADGDITLLSRLISGAINIVFNLKTTWLLIITLAVMFLKHRDNLKQSLLSHRYYYLCLLLSLGIVAVCGTNLERVVFYADFISILLLAALWSIQLSSRWQRCLIAFSCVVMLIYYVPALLVRHENHNNFCYIEQQMKEQDKDVIAVRAPLEDQQPVMDFFRRRFVNPCAEFGFYCCYMGFNAHDVNMRAAAAMYGKPQLVFLPEDVVQRITTDSTAYQHYELDEHQQLYIWQLHDNQPISKVIFHLKPEDITFLSLPQRLVAYKDNDYVLDDDFRYSVVHIAGRHYLVFTKPTTNIYRRIDSIEYF